MFLTQSKATKIKVGEHEPLAIASIKAKLRLEAYALHVFWLGIRLLGPERGSSLGARLANLASGPQSYLMRHIRSNLQVVLSDHDDAAIERVARDVVANLGRSVAEYPHLDHIAGADPGRYIEFTADVPDAAPTPTRAPAIYIGMHQANWEILSSLGAPLGKPMTIVVSPLTNPYVHRLVRKARPAVWVEQAERDNATRSLIRCLQEGRSVGLLADQRFRGGQPVPFFGHDALTAMGPAKIAIKFGCDLVPTRIERIGQVKFKITTFAAIHPAAEIEGEEAKAIDMMCRVNAHFERWIREKPGEWMCVKRRWPKELHRFMMMSRQHIADRLSDKPGIAA